MFAEIYGGSAFPLKAFQYRIRRFDSGYFEKDNEHLDAVWRPYSLKLMSLKNRWEIGKQQLFGIIKIAWKSFKSKQISRQIEAGRHWRTVFHTLPGAAKVKEKILSGFLVVADSGKSMTLHKPNQTRVSQPSTPKPYF